MKIYKVARTMEKVWLALAVFATIMAGYRVFTEGFEPSKMYVLIGAIIWVWYYVRRRVRLKLESTFSEEDQQSGELD